MKVSIIQEKNSHGNENNEPYNKKCANGKVLWILNRISALTEVVRERISRFFKLTSTYLKI